MLKISFASNVMDIVFHRYSGITQINNFTNFTMYATNFRQFNVAFQFFYLQIRNRSLQLRPSEKLQYLTQDLL